MRLGDRVKTKGFGEGTVVGFEKFTPSGSSYIASTPDARARVLVALDNPKAWYLAHETQPHPFMMGSDFLPEMAEPRKVSVAPFVQMKPPTPLPDLEPDHDVYTHMAETFRVISIRLGVLALFIFICLLYFR